MWVGSLGSWWAEVHVFDDGRLAVPYGPTFGRPTAHTKTALLALFSGEAASLKRGEERIRGHGRQSHVEHERRPWLEVRAPKLPQNEVLG